MRISVRIGRLVIDGANLTRADRAALPAAVQHQLALLLGVSPSGLPAPERGRGPVATAGPFDDIARAVAAAIHGALPLSVTAAAASAAHVRTGPAQQDSAARAPRRSVSPSVLARQTGRWR